MILTFDSNPILFDAWSSFFEVIGYFDRSVYSDEYLYVVRNMNNLGAAYVELDDKKRAKAYFEAAYQILLKFFGPDRPSTRTTAEWLAKL